MIVGETIFKMDGSPYYSPELSRQGLGAAFFVDVLHTSGVNTLLYAMIQSRNRDEQSWTDQPVPMTLQGVMKGSLDATDLREVIRLKIDFDIGEPAAASAQIFILEPAWRPYS
jgi:hypothetical protein